MSTFDESNVEQNYLGRARVAGWSVAAIMLIVAIVATGFVVNNVSSPTDRSSPTEQRAATNDRPDR
jgi:hypothetical protein